MADDLFQGLPPPSAVPPSPPPSEQLAASSADRDSPPPPAPAPILKSALKRDKHSESSHDEAPQKRLRFKTSVDATETQVIEAMKKIASHIKNPAKFSKASKLAVQLIQSGSVKSGTSNQFFNVLEAAMSSPSACNEPSLRNDYHALFSAVQDVAEIFEKQQRNQLATWTLKAVIANDLYTDDSFVYSKAAGKIKEAISNLPPATTEDDNEEAAALALAESKVVIKDTAEPGTTSATPTETKNNISDPFGLDALLPINSKKDEKPRVKDVTALNQKAEGEEFKRFIKAQREVLLLCLEIAARRYRVPWAQTVIDILVKHAFDNIDRFTARQRDAIEKLWASIKEQHIRRKQGKSVTGKLDMNAFEWLQEKYSREKISIRHAVGGSGERRAEQWLG
ncbi:hypothetical protein Cni_G22053 [Canna indica]|uniref:Uncharacterized protein n=1 Tax=Canna indica TaxID=4628 RepID=A0AAQ3KR74_9LILI|nr:hypothetical protein Cni_G22053 [Canna indica]